MDRTDSWEIDRLQTLERDLISIAQQAGERILSIYSQYSDSTPIPIQQKQDDSPVTKADIEAHHIILEGLRRLLPEVPIISEEGDQLPQWQERQQWTSCWLVDPLDGTKEFIQRTGEFTVNIALIHQGTPVLGCIYWPTKNISYLGIPGLYAKKLNHNDHSSTNLNHLTPSPFLKDQPTLTITTSRRHHRPITLQLLEQLSLMGPTIERLYRGSSLKLCLLAEGAADLYPRIGPTSEWDTAAGQAVLEAAGGQLIDSTGKPFSYNQRETLLNGDFLALRPSESREESERIKRLWIDYLQENASR